MEDDMRNCGWKAVIRLPQLHSPQWSAKETLNFSAIEISSANTRCTRFGVCYCLNVTKWQLLIEICVFLEHYRFLSFSELIIDFKMSSDCVYCELELVIDRDNLISGALKVINQLRKNWLFDRLKFKVRMKSFINIKLAYRYWKSYIYMLKYLDFHWWNNKSVDWSSS
jgi:hypothetical protein